MCDEDWIFTILPLPPPFCQIYAHIVCYNAADASTDGLELFAKSSLLIQYMQPSYFGRIFACFFAFLLLISSLQHINSTTCLPKDFGRGSIVCLCDSEFCDSLSPIEPLHIGEAVVFTSSKSGQRFHRQKLQWTGDAIAEQLENASAIVIDFSKRFQKLDGFGGAFTDATGINIANLPTAAQRNLLASYFGPNSIKYNLVRIPIASCDFSLGNYSYDDVDGDFDLKYFSLHKTDWKYKIPYLRESILLQNDLRFFGSPWSSPFWMKTTRTMQGHGQLIGVPGGKYFKTWAHYLVKFIQEYEKLGIKIWGLTVENEPTAGFVYEYAFQALGFTPEMERDFIKFDLGPILKKFGFDRMKLIILDDKRFMLPEWAEVVLSDPEAAKYISHIGLHWYYNKYAPVDILDRTHRIYPDVSLIGTEACAGVFGKEKVILGGWENAEEYAFDLIETLNHWYTAWVDWNLALDLNGGPNWVGNFVDSAIIVNKTAGEFYKQPIFYVMGHFSAFLPRDSVRVHYTIEKPKGNSADLFATSFLSSDGYKVLVILNKNDAHASISIKDAEDSASLQLEIPSRSISTVIWKK